MLEDDHRGKEDSKYATINGLFLGFLLPVPGETFVAGGPWIQETGDAEYNWKKRSDIGRQSTTGIGAIR